MPWPVVPPAADPLSELLPPAMSLFPVAPPAQPTPLLVPPLVVLLQEMLP